MAESVEEWGRRQAANAPLWSDDDWRSVLAILGLRVTGLGKKHRAARDPRRAALTPGSIVDPAMNDDEPAEVHGRPDLQCPITWGTVRRVLSNAVANPWRGGPLPRANAVDTTAILEPNRPTRVVLTYDHAEAALHLSVSHPRLAVTAGGGAGLPPAAVELPSLSEVDAWTRVFFGARHGYTELEVGNVVHVRLFFDIDGKPVRQARVTT